MKYVASCRLRPASRSRLRFHPGFMQFCGPDAPSSRLRASSGGRQVGDHVIGTGKAGQEYLEARARRLDRLYEDEPVAT